MLLYNLRYPYIASDASVELQMPLYNLRCPYNFSDAPILLQMPLYNPRYPYIEYRGIWTSIRASETLVRIGTSEAIYGHLRLYRGICDYIGTFETLYGLLNLYRSIWDYIRASEVILMMFTFLWFISDDFLKILRL